MAGFIKIYRSLLDWEWYSDINTCRLFTHLLLTVNWKDGKWKGEAIKRGQRVTSIGKLAKETRLTIRQIRTSLEHLKSTGEVTITSTNRYTLITVEKYEEYQGCDDIADKPIDKPIDKQSTTIEESKNKELNIYGQRFDEFWQIYPKKKAKADAYKSWQRIKPNEELHRKIISMVIAYKQSEDWKKENGKFIPHPATWLNQGRWDDEISEPKPEVKDNRPWL